MRGGSAWVDAAVHGDDGIRQVLVGQHGRDQPPGYVWAGVIRAEGKPGHRGDAAARRKEENVPIATINPATGETLKTYDEMSEADVERCLPAAAAAHASYRRTGFDARAGWMRQAAAILDDERDQIAAMMTTEMGKTLSAARQEAAKC